jgi:hypothetical protein
MNFQIVLTKDIVIGKSPYIGDNEVFIEAGSSVTNFNNSSIEVILPKVCLYRGKRFYLEGDFAKKVWDMAMEHDRSTVAEKTKDTLYFSDEEAAEARDRRRMIEAHIKKSDKRLEVTTQLLAVAIAGNSHFEPNEMIDSAIMVADLLIKKIYEF